MSDIEKRTREASEDISKLSYEIKKKFDVSNKNKESFINEKTLINSKRLQKVTRFADDGEKPETELESQIVEIINHIFRR